MIPSLRKLLILVLFVGAGCSTQPKIDLQYTALLEPKDEKYFFPAAVERDVDVTVSADSSDVPIDLYILKAQSEDQAVSIMRKQSLPDMLASKVMTKSPKFPAKLIANESYVIAVVNHNDIKTARVTITIKNRSE